jgi:nucleoside 2-deoxyribosyltransferase
MIKKIYISGKISGIENEAPALFENVEKRLKESGFDVVNPMKLNHQHDKSWHSYMKEDVKELCDCDTIYMLSNWTDSKGAIIEHTIAMYLGLKVIYQPCASAIIK